MGLEIVYYGGFKLPDLKARGVHAVLSCVSLARAGVPVTLLLRDGPRDAGKALAPYGVTPPPNLTIRTGTDTRLGRLLGRGTGLKARVFAALRPVAGRTKIVYTMDYPGVRAAPSLLRYRRLFRYRFVFELHNLTCTVLREEADRWADHPERRRQLERRARDAERKEAAVYPRSDALVANSPGTLQAAVDTFGAPPHRLVLPNGVDQTRFRVEAREPVTDLLYTGSLDGWKGVDVLIDALARLEGVRLSVAGFGEPHVVDSILARARDRGVADRLEFLGYRPHHEIPALLAAARVVVVSTSGRYREGRDFTCPMKLLEAFAAGRPVVATDLPSIRSLLTDGREGLLFRDDDPESLATAVRTLLDDPALAARLASAARARAEEFTWEARARKLVGFLEEMVRG